MKQDTQKQQALEQFHKVEEIFGIIENNLPASKIYDLGNAPAYDEFNGKISEDLTFLYHHWNRNGSSDDECLVNLFAKGKKLAAIKKNRCMTTLVDEHDAQFSVMAQRDTTNLSVASAAWDYYPGLVTAFKNAHDEKYGEGNTWEVTKELKVYHAKHETADEVVNQIYDAVVLGKDLTRQQTKKLSKLNILTNSDKMLKPILDEILKPNSGREM